MVGFIDHHDQYPIRLRGIYCDGSEENLNQCKKAKPEEDISIEECRKSVATLKCFGE